MGLLEAVTHLWVVGLQRVKDEGTAQPLHVIHHFRAGTVYFSRGSSNSAPGISAGVSSTSRRVAILNKIDCISATVRDIAIVQSDTSTQTISVLLHAV